MFFFVFVAFKYAKIREIKLLKVKFTCLFTIVYITLIHIITLPPKKYVHQKKKKKKKSDKCM